jgi:translation initiation factor IF-3
MPPPPGKNPYYRKNTDPFAHIRRNQRIKAPEIRVIGPDGKQFGVMSVEKALQIATQIGLDLVEVSPNSQPPVCRILDFGKYKYEESKKTSGAKSHASKIKEIKLRPNIDPHDLQTKLKRSEAFLFDGNKLKLTLQFRGREMAYKDVGFQTIQKAIEELLHVGTADNEPRLVGRSITVMVSPLSVNKRKRKFTEDNHVESEDDDSGEDEDNDEDGHHPPPGGTS